MNKILKFWPFIICVFLGLTPLLWFYHKGNALINGVDTNFPLDPEVWFLRRFYVWNGVANGGSDFSSSTAGLFFHLIQFIPYKLGLNLQQVEIISLTFWFLLIVWGSFVLARALFAKKPAVQLLFVTLYSFNIYLFNTWENVKVANLSLVASLPLTLATLVLLREGRISYLKAGIVSILAGIILSGAGINPAYFATFFLAILIYSLSNVLVERRKQFIFKRLKELIFVIAVVMIVNIFWFLPTASYILTSITSSNSINSLGFTDWVTSVSADTSLLNVMRLQGAWDWYALDNQTHQPFYIPYALTYFTSLPFILFSFLLPILALASFLTYRQQKSSIYLAFGLMFIAGIFLGAGTHPPTGYLFRFLANHLPFFSLFRSPWYIFTPLYVVALAALVASLIDSLNIKWRILFSRRASYLVTILPFVLILATLAYCYPLLTGKIFRPGREDSFYVNFPSYIFDSSRWLKSGVSGRLIGYPNDTMEKFKWGYRGVDSILNLLTDKETIFSPINTTNSAVSGLVDQLYLQLKKGQIDSARALALKLGVTTVFEKQDQDSLILKLPQKVQDLPHTSYGPWVFYTLNKDTSPKIYSPSRSFLGYPYQDQAELLTILGPEDIFLNPVDQMVLKSGDLIKNSGTLVSTVNSQYQEFANFQALYAKQSKGVKTRDLSVVHYTFNVPSGDYYQPALEKFYVEDFGFNLDRPIDVEADGIKSTWIVDKVSDSYLFFKPVYFTAGAHKVAFNLNNKNLIILSDFKVGSFIPANTLGNFQVAKDGELNSLIITNEYGDQDLSYQFEIWPFESMFDYYFQTKYKHIYGQPPRITLEQKKDGSPTKRQTEQLPLSPEWNNFSFYYHPHDSNSVLQISLTASPVKNNPLGTKIAFAQLSAQRVFANNLVLIKEASALFRTTPRVTFSKVSSVEYRGEVSDVQGDHLLTFLENYSQGWKIQLYDGNWIPLSLSPLHLSANLYANAWYIQGFPHNYRFKIYYQPQELMDLGLKISTLGIVIIVLLLVLQRRYIRRSDGK